MQKISASGQSSLMTKASVKSRRNQRVEAGSRSEVLAGDVQRSSSHPCPLASQWELQNLEHAGVLQAGHKPRCCERQLRMSTHPAAIVSPILPRPEGDLTSVQRAQVTHGI